MKKSDLGFSSEFVLEFGFGSLVGSNFGFELEFEMGLGLRRRGGLWFRKVGFRLSDCGCALSRVTGGDEHQVAERGLG